ncbi:MAG: hypothetical protein LBL66_03845 [Clostridiales bacterium]|nr:hypothetical protein [Clostridiales bacterium]
MKEESARAFLCLVEIAASRFALLAMTRGAFALLAMTCRVYEQYGWYIRNRPHNVGDFSTSLEMTWGCAFGMREESARAFLCPVAIAASRFALLAMTNGAFALLCNAQCHPTDTIPYSLLIG